MECVKSASHTPAPEGYVEWHAWASTMFSRGFRQRRCDGCNRFEVWVGTGKTPDVAAFDGWCLTAAFGTKYHRPYRPTR